MGAGAGHGDADGYTLDLAYPVQYHPDLNPLRQIRAVGAAGFSAPREDRPFTYLELGCGPAFSLLAHAAAYPEARFVGVDINADHIQWAQAMAAAAELKNIELRQASFADLASANLEPCEFISLHGVWSWISAENRACILDLVAALLAPTGVVYVSYNCLPGMAAVAPLRELMLLAPDQASAEARVAARIALAEQVMHAGAKFFEDSPAARRRLESLRDLAPGYVAHEYFNRDWQAFYHRDVAASFAAAGLSFAGQVRRRELEMAAFSDQARALINGAPSAVERETLADFFSNRTLRGDLYVREAAARDDAKAQDEAQRFAYVARPNGLPADTPARYRALAQRLATAPAAARDVAETAAEIGEAAEMLQFLADINVLAPALGTEGEDARRPATRQFNDVALGAFSRGAAMPGLVSPITGAVFPMSKEELQVAALLADHAVAQPAPEAAAAFIRDLPPLLRYLAITD